MVQKLRPQEGSELSRLTPRQLDVLRLIVQGHVNTAIAGKLVISVESVENLINGLFQGLGLPGDGPVHPGSPPCSSTWTLRGAGRHDT